MPGARVARAWAWLALAQVACLPAPAWAAGAAQDRLCEQPPTAAAPAAAALPGCSAAWCMAVGQEQLCNCRQGQDWWAQRRAGGRVQQQWRARVSPLMGAQAFEVSQADLEGSGTPQWLVAQFQSQSNGLGVRVHQLCVLWPDRPMQAPRCREVQDWGVLTLLVQEPGRGHCSLMDSRWQPGREAGRGEGTYAVGRLLELDRGQWRPVAGRAPVSRRLLDEFMNERDAAPQGQPPRLWYQHPTAR